MANTFAPFGFLQYQGGAGGAPTFAQSTRRIASTNSTAIYFGDPVIPVTGSATGYITRGATDGTTVVAGIFVGCQYLSVAQKRTVWSRYWPGSDASGDVIAYVIDDPNSRFLVQASGSSFYNANATSSNINSLPIGQYVTFNIGSGSTSTGQSGAYLDATGTAVGSPFIIVSYVFDPPGQNGTDPSTNYPYVVVGFNNEVWRTNGAGPTGIS
jgi:hypothetical protein